MSEPVLKDLLSISSMVKNKGDKTFPALKGKLFKVKDLNCENLDDYGNLIFQNDNTVTLSGALAALEHLFRVPAPYVPNYLVATTSGPKPTGASVVGSETTQLEDSTVCLFGVGIIGDEYLTFGNIPDPDFKQMNVEGMIPLRITENSSIVPPNQPLVNGKEHNKYAFPCTLADGSCGWYLKEFESDAEIKALFKNATSASSEGTSVDNTNIDTQNGLGIEVYAGCKIRISSDDVIDYFIANNSLNFARYNSIGLFLAEKTTDPSTGENTYENIRLFSVVNIENVSVKNPTDSVYIYKVYTAI